MEQWKNADLAATSVAAGTLSQVDCTSDTVKSSCFRPVFVFFSSCSRVILVLRVTKWLLRLSFTCGSMFVASVIFSM